MHFSGHLLKLVVTFYDLELMIINEPFPWTPQTLSACSTRSCSWWGRLSWGTLTMILRLLPEDQSAAAPRQDERSNQIFFSSWNCVNMLNLCCWCIESLICRGIVKNCWFVSFCRSKRPLTDLRNSAATSCILRPHSPVLTVEQDLQNAGVNGCD